MTLREQRFVDSGERLLRRELIEERPCRSFRREHVAQ
jgi:hypothetical protein